MTGIFKEGENFVSHASLVCRPNVYNVLHMHASILSYKCQHACDTGMLKKGAVCGLAFLRFRPLSP